LNCSDLYDDNKLYDMNTVVLIHGVRSVANTDII
jgi:hypothetical protein